MSGCLIYPVIIISIIITTMLFTRSAILFHGKWTTEKDLVTSYSWYLLRYWWYYYIAFIHTLKISVATEHQLTQATFLVVGPPNWRLSQDTGGPENTSFWYRHTKRVFSCFVLPNCFMNLPLVWDSGCLHTWHPATVTAQTKAQEGTAEKQGWLDSSLLLLDEKGPATV